MVERLVFNDTVNQWRIYDTYLSYDQIKDVVDTEDSETVEEQEPAGVRWEQLVVEEDGVLDAAPVAAALLLRATDGGKDQAGNRYHNFSLTQLLQCRKAPGSKHL